MIKFLPLIIIVIMQFSAYSSHSQSVTKRTISSAGKLVSTPGINLNFTVGELVIENYRNNTVDIKTGLFGKEYYDGSVLPVVLEDFRLVVQEINVKLYWAVTQESNKTVYEIEKSTDGVSFSTIGKINTNRSTEIHKNYSFIDNNFLKKSFYRLKIIDKDGKSKYSNILTATPVAENNKIIVYPNPAKSLINIIVSSTNVDTAQIFVRNTSGATIITKNASLSSGNNSFSINLNSLANSTYFLTIITSEKKYNQTILKL